MVSALGQSSISGVTEGAETRGGSSSTGTSSSKPYEFGRREARRDAGIASARRAGRIGGASEQGALSRNYASKGDDLSEALRGAIEGNGGKRPVRGAAGGTVSPVEASRSRPEVRLRRSRVGRWVAGHLSCSLFGSPMRLAALTWLSTIVYDALALQTTYKTVSTV